MAIVRFTCPECDEVFKAGAAPPGKKMKCPACKHAFVPPSDEDEEEALEEDKSRGKTKKAAVKAGDPPFPRKRRRDDNDNDDDDDDEEDDVPAKKKKKQASGVNVLYWAYRGASVLVFLVLLGVLAWVVLNPRRPKLNDESIVEAAPGETRSVTIDAIPDNQTVNVSAAAINGRFNIYVFLKKDRAEAEKAIDHFKDSAKFLASKLKTTEADLQVMVPAKENAVVLLIAADSKKAEVKLKITN